MRTLLVVSTTKVVDKRDELHSAFVTVCLLSFFHNIVRARGIKPFHNEVFLHFTHKVPSLSLVALVTPSCVQEEFSNATCE